MDVKAWTPVRWVADKGFTFEVQEIVRLCRNLHERERHRLFREALRLAYQSSVRGGAELPR